MKSRIVLAGGTGFIGRYLSPFLVLKNYEVVLLSRAESDHRSAIRKAHWDGKTLGEWIEVIKGAFGIVNLTGRSINVGIHQTINARSLIPASIPSTCSVRRSGDARYRPKVSCKSEASDSTAIKANAFVTRTRRPETIS